MNTHALEHTTDLEEADLRSLMNMEVSGLLGGLIRLNQAERYHHRLNVFVLGLGSIQVNTFPSGHTAGAFATALAAAQVVPSSFAPLLVLAASITIGSVLGRYHYAADSVAGVMVAVAVWTVAG